MGTSALAIDRSLAVDTEKTVPTKWTRFLERLNLLLQNHFESEWERRTGTPWKEWHTWGEWRQLDERTPKAVLSEEKELDQGKKRRFESTESREGFRYFY